MPVINTSDLPVIAANVSKFIKRSDTQRLDFSRTTLTIYSVVTSGLVALTLNIKIDDNVEKFSLLAIITTSVIIVLFAILERFAYFLISDEIAKRYVDHVNKTGKHLNNQIFGKEWQSILIKISTIAILISFVLNLISVLIFTYSRVI